MVRFGLVFFRFPLIISERDEVGVAMVVVDVVGDNVLVVECF